MSCGTPVVAYRRGSMPEIIDEGITGFVVDDVAAAVDRVADAVALDRRAVRARARERFDVERMVDGYLEVYDLVLASPQSRT
jgi:glycosyltransferase involved in cell wall biosynthesis